MNIEEGLLSKLIEKLKKELQPLIRYEVLRGLDKPEANIWNLSHAPITTFEEFLTSTVCNSIYSSETMPLQSYMSMKTPHQTKFKLIKDSNLFCLPGDKFLTQEYLKDLMANTKSLLLISSLPSDSSISKELVPHSHLIYDIKTLARYMPSNFTKISHDKEYVAKLFAAVEFDQAVRLLNQVRVAKQIKEFKFQADLKYRLKFVAPQVPKPDPLWNCITEVLETIETIDCREAALKDAQKDEAESTSIAKEVASRSYNEDFFDQIIEV